jgi:hypothetical protein
VTYHDALRALEFPFWDWHSFTGGYDLVSDGVAGAMYPVHLVLWWAFDPVRAHDIYVVFHLWAGGLFMYLLLRHWGLRFGPAIIGGTAWMLAPFNVGWAQAEMITPVLIVVPLLFWSVSSALQRGTFISVVYASAAIALALVAGNIVVFLVAVWVVAAWGACVLIRAAITRRPKEIVRRKALVLVGIAAGGLALSAFSLVPTLLNLLSLGRKPSALEDVLPPEADLVSVVGGLWSAPAVDQPVVLFFLGWCGKVVLLLAIIGLFHRPGRRALAVTLVVVFTLLPSTPWMVHIGWYALPPLRAVAGFGRLTFLASFGLAILAAGGTAAVLSVLSRIRSNSTDVRRRIVAAGAVAVLASAIVAELLPFATRVNPPWTDADQTPIFPVTPAEKAMRQSSGQWPGLTLPITPPSPVKDDGTPYYSLWAGTAHIADVDSVGGYDSAVPQRAAALSRIMEGTPVETAVSPFSTAYLPSFGVEWTRLDLAERLGVTHVYTPPGADLADSAYVAQLPDMRRVHRGTDGDVWELTSPVRGPRLVQDAVFVDSVQEAFERLTAPEHDVRTSVVLEASHPAESNMPEPAPGTESNGRVIDADRGSNDARVEVSVDQPSWLVMPIGFAEGWRAEMDGRRLPIRPADGAMSAVRLPNGQHTVTFTYRPRGLALGASMSSAALLLAAGFPLVSRARRRRQGLVRIDPGDSLEHKEPAP